MQYENISYSKMVSLLAKSGEIIQQQLSPEDCHAVHMCLGIAGELGEYVIAFDPVNKKEEFGDLEFYLEGLRQNYFITYEMIDVEEPMPNEYQYMLNSSLMCVLIGEIIDIVKKNVLYRKPIDKDALIMNMRFLEHVMKEERAENNLTREDCLNANREKLLTGEKARYALGQYTDEQAQNRADKQV